MTMHHDEVFDQLSAEDRERMIRGEIVIVTTNGNTTIEEAPRATFKQNYDKTPALIRPSHPLVGAKREY